MYPNLEAELIRRGISRPELIKIAGIKSTATYDKLRGSTDWRIGECKRIANHLGESIDYLFKTREEVDQELKGK